MSQILPQQTLTIDFPKGKRKGKSPEDLGRAQAFHAFSSNDALNFSCWYQVWQVNFFVAVLWSGIQKEHLELALLLKLSREDDTLPLGLLSIYFPGMFRGRILSGLYFPYEAILYCRPTFHHCGRAFMGQLVTNPPVDLVPFTFYICLPTTIWDFIVSRFQTSGVLQILAGDVPWTCENDGHPLISFSFSASSSIYFLHMNLWSCHTRNELYKWGEQLLCCRT